MKKIVSIIAVLAVVLSTAGIVALTYLRYRTGALMDLAVSEDLENNCIL